ASPTRTCTQTSTKVERSADRSSTEAFVRSSVFKPARMQSFGVQGFSLLGCGATWRLGSELRTDEIPGALVRSSGVCLATPSTGVKRPSAVKLHLSQPRRREE